MHVSTIHRQGATGDIPLEQLARNRTLDDSEKIAELSRQFESLLVRQILAEAQKGVSDLGSAGQGVASAIYRDIVTGIQADNISRSGAMGLAQTLERQLVRQVSQGTGSPNANKTEA